MKQKNFKGAIIWLFLAVVSLSIAIGLYVRGSQPVTVESLTAEKAVFPDENKQNMSVFELYYAEQILTSDKKEKVVYLVHNNEKLYALMAAKDDAELEAAFTKLDKGESASIVVKTLSNAYNIQKEMQSSLKPEELSHYETAFILDRSTILNERSSVTLWMYILGVVGVVFLGVGMYRYFRNSRRYDALFQLFPELSRDDVVLENEAAYYDKKAKWYVYKDHLISLSKGLDFYDLTKVVWCHYVKYTVVVNFIPNVMYYIKVYTDDFKAHKVFPAAFASKKAEYSEALVDYLYVNYPNMLVGMAVQSEYQALKAKSKATSADEK